MASLNIVNKKKTRKHSKWEPDSCAPCAKPPATAVVWSLLRNINILKTSRHLRCRWHILTGGHFTMRLSGSSCNTQRLIAILPMPLRRLSSIEKSPVWPPPGNIRRAKIRVFKKKKKKIPLCPWTIGVITHPAALLEEPGVELLPNDLENPANDSSNVFQVISGQSLEEEEKGGLNSTDSLTNGHRRRTNQWSCSQLVEFTAPCSNRDFK